MEQIFDHQGTRFRLPYMEKGAQARRDMIRKWCDAEGISNTHSCMGEGTLIKYFYVWTIHDPVDAVLFKMTWC